MQWGFIRTGGVPYKEVLHGTKTELSKKNGKTPHSNRKERRVREKHTGGTGMRPATRKKRATVNKRKTVNKKGQILKKS